MAELVRHVGEAIDRFPAGEVDVFDTDQVIFQYSGAAKELWKFCNVSDVEFSARVIDDSPSADWWERRAPSKAGDWRWA